MSKNDPLVDEVELIHINPTYADVRYCNGREAIVSIRDFVPNQQSAVDKVPIMLNYLKFLVTANLLQLMQLNYPTMNLPLMI